MKKKNIIMNIDDESGARYIALLNGEIARTISLSDEGCPFLDSLGADIVLDFDEGNNLIGIELLGV